MQKFQFNIAVNASQWADAWNMVFLAAGLIFTPDFLCPDHVSGVIMEPHCVPAVRESAGLCLIALQSSRPQAGYPGSPHIHKCLMNCSNGQMGR